MGDTGLVESPADEQDPLAAAEPAAGATMYAVFFAAMTVVRFEIERTVTIARGATISVARASGSRIARVIPEK